MLQTLCQTTNFTVEYDDTYSDAVKRAQALLSVVESEFSLFTDWFNVGSGFGPGNRVTVRVNRPAFSGALNYGYGSSPVIDIDTQQGNRNDALAAEMVKMLFVAEFVEILMDYNSQHVAPTWHFRGSDGEGLSRLCARERYPAAHDSYNGPEVNDWLQSATRRNWVVSNGSDTDPDSVGCSLLFLYYLKSQLNYSIPQIIRGGATSLEGLYQNLTGTSGGYAAFTGLLNEFLPIGNTPMLPTDDPFPLLDLARRALWIDTRFSPTGIPTTIASGAVTERFLGCATRQYHFDINATPQTLTCVGNNIGFGAPQYSWRVNGVPVSGASGQFQILASVTIHDPSNPVDGTTSFRQVTVDFAQFSTTRTSTFSLTLPTVGPSHVDLTVELDAFDQWHPESSSSTTENVVVSNERVVWEPSYYRNARHCRDQFLGQFAGLAPPFDRLKDVIGVILTLPDPPPQDHFRSARQMRQIAEVLDIVTQSATPAVAHEVLGFFEKRAPLGPKLSGAMLSPKSVPDALQHFTKDMHE